MKTSKTSPPPRALDDVERSDTARVGGEIEDLYRRDGDRLWWAVLAWAGDREIASDAVAEAYAQAIGRGDDLRDPAAWVWKVAFRIAAGELKRRGRTIPLADGPYEMPEPGELFDALAKLSDRQRAAVVLHHYAGYRLRDIAEMLGLQKATVGVHLTRGRRRLRQILEDDDD
jgi:RNA polymerase sigma-70 factor (ECF subfamily)